MRVVEYEEEGQQPLTRHYVTPSSQGAREKLRSYAIRLIRNTNFLLAPWGEDAHRAGEGLEGLLGLYFLYERTKQENTHSDIA